MSDVLKADIFFFVTTIAVAVVTVFLSLALYYLIQVLRRARTLSDKALEEAAAISHDLREVRQSFREEGSGIASIVRMAGLVGRFFPKKKGRKRKEEAE